MPSEATLFFTGPIGVDDLIKVLFIMNEAYHVHQPAAETCSPHVLIFVNLSVCITLGEWQWIQIYFPMEEFMEDLKLIFSVLLENYSWDAINDIAKTYRPLLGRLKIYCHTTIMIKLDALFSGLSSNKIWRLFFIADGNCIRNEGGKTAFS